LRGLDVAGQLLELVGGVRADQRLVAVDLQLAGAGVDLQHERLGVAEVAELGTGVLLLAVADQDGGQQAARRKKGDTDESAELLGQRAVGEPTGPPSGGGGGSGSHVKPS
jgi:hypothetical protein